MFVQDNLQNPKVISDINFPNTILFMMFTGVVIIPLVLLASGGRAPNTLWQSGLVWTLPAIAILLLISAGTSLMMFRSKSYAGAATISIS
jgi:hypothetical protein